jgi:hypothetical protein
VKSPLTISEMRSRGCLGTMGIVAMVCRRGNFDNSCSTDATGYFGKDDLADRVLGARRTSV